MATPILLATLGEIYSELSGVMNLGIEGIMLASAFISFYGAFISDSLWVGVFAAMGIGVLFALLHAYACVTLGVNQVLVGLILIILTHGFTLFSFSSIFTGVPSTIPTFKPILFQFNFFIYASVILGVLFWIILYKTSWGLKIRAVGENPKAADTMGINVYKIRYSCVLLGGAMTGLAGSYLVLGWFGAFTQEMIAGRGWIAIVITIFSTWNPLWAILGCLFFGITYAIAMRMQFLIAIPYHFLLMLPYIFAIIAMLFVYKKAKQPASLLIPYKSD
jgi:simple sugar transport system permease protein